MKELYETVIGLEVHAEMNTKAKIFCGCPAKFGGEPNTQVCPVCMGLPGALPSLNGEALKKTVQAGLAMGCEITGDSSFDRKNYFYPDLPKAYQISQLYAPICQGGGLTLEGGRHIRIREIHMEEDAGKLIHDPWTESTLCDYNRCGVPLMEIVTQPDFRSADEVIGFLHSLKTLLEYLRVTDGKMHEGSLRADLNISVKKRGEEALGTRTEMKNMNSFKAIQRAVLAESKRQIDVLEAGGSVVQETRRWDDNRDASTPMRSKEDAQDYRYFPEPDIPTVHTGQGWVAGLRAALPELPKQKAQRYAREYGLPAHDISILCPTFALTGLLEETIAWGAAPKEAANWIITEVLRLCRETDTDPAALVLEAKKLAGLIAHVRDGRINRQGAKRVLELVFLSNAEVDESIQGLGLKIQKDEGAEEAAVSQVLIENPDAVKNYRAGKTKALGFLAGQCMKKLCGQADPGRIAALLEEALRE